MCVRKLPYYRSRAGFGSPLTACVNKLLTRVEVSFRGSQRSSHKTNQKFTKKPFNQYVVRETIFVSSISL